MKKTISTTVAILGIVCVAQAQQANTSYGEFAGSSGYHNSFFGAHSGQLISSGSENTAVGYRSLQNNTESNFNTAVGSFSLNLNTTGSSNTALGYNALAGNTSGIRNTGSGANALSNNSIGYDNTAIGHSALYYNTSGSQNTANGAFSLADNTTGYANVSTGFSALRNNTTGYANAAHGYATLHHNTTGYRNVATGQNALYYNTTGIGNVAHGFQGLYQNEAGNYNVACGNMALRNNLSGNNNIACGNMALRDNVSGSYNIAIGYLSGTTIEDLNNTVALGYNTKTTAANQVRIGNASITSIGGQVEWSTLSDGRFKRDLKEDVGGLDFIMQLRPVSYVVDKDAVNKFLGTPDSVSALTKNTTKPVRQVGFVAQEVETLVKKNGYVFSGVETPQNNHDTYAIRYAEFVVPLVKAVQELSARVDEMSALLLDKAEHTDKVSTDKGVLLHQNTPNPFSSTTKISMSLPEGAAKATVIVYNLEGKQLKAIPVQGSGETSVQIQANELTPGMYFYALLINGKVASVKRMILTGE